MVVGLGELKIRSRRSKQGEIAYAVKVGQWRRGIGSAIATELLTRAFGSFGLHRVAATCDPRNKASAAAVLVRREDSLCGGDRLWAVAAAGLRVTL